MGATDSELNREDKIDEQYKLIRRYTCPCYGQLTVIQKRTNKELLAMKQFVSEQNQLTKRIQRRKSFRHPNLITLVDFWTESEPSICSNLKKIGVLYQYFERNLDQELAQQITIKQEQKQLGSKGFTDSQLTEIIWQFIDCLNYLEEKGVKYLLSNLKSVKLSDKRQIKLLQSQETLLYDQKSSSNPMIHYSTRRQFPFHPSYEVGQNSNSVMSKQILIVQNIFTVGVIVLCLCHSKQPSQLGIFGRGGYNFDKLAEAKTQIADIYPKTSFHLSQMLRKTFPKNIKYENFVGNYQLTLKQTSVNQFCIKDFKVIPIQKVERKESRKKLNPLKAKNC